MAEVVLFHHAQGLTPGVVAFADELRRAGHTVHTPEGELEAKDDIKRRIEEASTFVDIDQLCLCPRCGFSSTLEGNSLSRDQQIAKLRPVVEAAEEVWGAQ